MHDVCIARKNNNVYLFIFLYTIVVYRGTQWGIYPDPRRYGVEMCLIEESQNFSIKKSKNKKSREL